MPRSDMSFFKQVQRNSVALISLAIALSSLTYTAWRYEKTEDNQNQRFAAFEILLKLGELQQLVFHNHYDMDTTDRGNPRTGWAYVLTIRDLSRILPTKYHDDADQLLATWDDNWEGLGASQSSVNAILDEIERTRETMLELLRSLQ